MNFQTDLIDLMLKFLKERKDSYEKKGYVPTIELLVEDLIQIQMEGDVNKFWDAVDNAVVEEKDHLAEGMKDQAELEGIDIVEK